MTMDDDYYGLIGVNEDAETTDIRAAYREKKAALDAKGDKTEIGKLNRAWNVLSDPYQRGRYDQQRAQANEGEGDDEELATAVVASSAGGASQPPPRRRLFEPRPRGERPPMPDPT